MTDKDKWEGDVQYTRDETVKQLLLIQAHASDGSALRGCLCLPSKHFYHLEALSEEGIGMSENPKEKAFYGKLAPLSRDLRKAIVDQTWDFPAGEAKSAGKSCILEAELECCGKHTSDYSGCTCNPDVVCGKSEK